MEQRLLGRSGILAPRLGLGCATFGREIPEQTCFQIMDYAVERGITLFDTAEAYGGGQARQYRRHSLGVDDVRETTGEMHSSEKIVGRWLRSRGSRDSIVLLTKVTADFTRQHVKEALAASLERLQTGYVDLYLYHQFDAASPREEAAAALDEAVTSGLARAGGCSNYPGVELAAALEISRARGLSRFELIESNYNLAAREIEQDIVPIVERESLGLVTYSPLAAGFLAGKYTPDRAALPPGTRFDVIPGHADIYFKESNFRTVTRLHETAERLGIPPLRLAMAWCFQNPAVTTVLAGARTTAHLDNALAALEMPIDPAVLAEIDGWA